MKSTLKPLFFILVLSTLLFGISYSLWSKPLTINGSVATGTLEAEFTYWFSNDPPGQDQIDPDYDKDVASTTCTVSQDKQTAFITIENAYPCYHVHFSFTIKNTGTIPWKIQGITVDGKPLVSNELRSFDLDGDGDLDITLEIIDSVGEQVDPGDSIETSLDLHVEQGAEEGFTYTFTITILVVQWNEYEEVPPP